jgi:hypothetical protein
MQASVRRVDRVIVQVGLGLSSSDDCDVVALTDAQTAALEALAAEPNGGIVLNEDGTFTALRFVPVEPPAQFLLDAQIARAYLADAQVDALIAADPATLTPTQQVARKNAIALRAVIRLLARVIQQLV